MNLYGSTGKRKQVANPLMLVYYLDFKSITPTPDASHGRTVRRWCTKQDGVSLTSAANVLESHGLTFDGYERWCKRRGIPAYITPEQRMALRTHRQEVYDDSSG